MASIGSLVADLKLESASFLRDLAKAQQATARSTSAMSKSMAQMQKGFSTAANSLKGLVAGFVGLAAVRRVATFTKQALDSASAIKEQAQALGLTAEQFQAYQIAAQQAGGSAEGINKQLGFFARVVGQAKQGTGPLVAGLKDTNAQLLQNIKASGSMQEATDLMLNAIKGTASGFEQSRIAAVAFGKGAKEAIVLASDSSTEARQKIIDLGLVITNEAADSVDDLMDKVALLQKSFTAGFATAFIKTFAGSISTTDQQLKSLSDTGAKVGAALAEGLKAGVEAFRFLAQHSEEVKTAVVALVAVKLATWAFASASAMVVLARATEEAAIAITALKTSVMALSRLIPIIALAVSLEQQAEDFVAASEKVKAANEANAASVTKVAAQYEAARQRIFAYTEAVKNIPPSPLTEGATSFGGLFGVPGVAEAALPLPPEKETAEQKAERQAAVRQRLIAVNRELAESERLLDEQASRSASLVEATRTPYEKYMATLKEVAKVHQTTGEIAVAAGRMQQQAALELAGTYVDAAAQVTGTLASAFQDNKAFAIANAVMNVAQGITQALTLPFPLNWAQVAAVTAAGIAQIANIKSARPGGGTTSRAASGGSGRAATENAAGGVHGPQRSIFIKLEGSSNFTPEQMRNLIGQLVDAQKDGAKLVLAKQ